MRQFYKARIPTEKRLNWQHW